MAYELALDILIVVAVTAFAVTQIVLPLLRGSRLFPALSKESHSVADDIAAVDQEIETERLRHELEARRKTLAQEKADTHAADSN